MFTLDQLQLRQLGRVESITGDDAITQRIYELGLLEGDLVELIAIAPLGDPIEIRLANGSRLSLRRAEAARICVTPQLLS